MNDTTTEYIDRPKNFSIKPADDPDKLFAIRLREQVCDDPNLSDGSVRLFVRILDIALDTTRGKIPRGKLIMSKQDVGKLIHCNERTVRRRAIELINGNYIWTSLMPRRNTKPITIWHITSIIPENKIYQESASEPARVNGALRYDSGFERTGKDAAGQKRRKASLLVDRFGKEIFFNFPANTVESGHSRPWPPDNIDRSQRTELSSASGQNRPFVADAAVRAQRPELTAGNGQNSPQGQVAGVQLQESQIETEKSISKTKSTSKGLKPPVELGTDYVNRLHGLAVKRDGLKSADWQRHNFEKQWRARFNEDSDKAGRVLEQVLSAARTGEITGKVGEYWNYIWSEFASRKAVGK